MSSVNLKRIKQIRPKTNGGFDTVYPLGVDGLLTDMVSGLDLQQELTIGGNHYVEINQTNTAVEIKQWYFSQAMGNNTLDYMKTHNKVTYSVFVNITTAIDYYLIDERNNSEDEDSIITYTINPQDGIVDRVAVSSNQERIQITLYNGLMDSANILHQKVITITESGNDYTISEQLDWNETGSNSEPEEEGGEG